MNFTKTFGSFRTFGSSAKRFSGTGEHPTDGSSFKMWRYATYFFCVPVVTAATYINLDPTLSMVIGQLMFHTITCESEQRHQIYSEHL